jgi:hypothetical protein
VSGPIIPILPGKPPAVEKLICEQSSLFSILWPLNKAFLHLQFVSLGHWSFWGTACGPGPVTVGQAGEIHITHIIIHFGKKTVIISPDVKFSLNQEKSKIFLWLL